LPEKKPIALASVHASFQVKEKAREYLISMDIERRGLSAQSLDGMERVDAIEAHYHREKSS